MLIVSLSLKRARIINAPVSVVCSALTIIHERILHLGTGKSDVAEIVQHMTGASCVDELAQTEVGDPIQERENVRARLRHGH